MGAQGNINRVNGRERTGGQNGELRGVMDKGDGATGEDK